jgi:hypothetical protein
MAEIIDLGKRKKEEREQRAARERMKRMETVLKMFQCTRCSMKCMKCGSQLDTSSPSKTSIPYRLCGNCTTEYEEFMQRLQGGGNPEYYWYNQQWMDVWKAWMHYQDALGRYEISEEFRRLLEEIRNL